MKTVSLPALVAFVLAFPRSAQLLAAVGVFSLGFALTLQFLFGADPCILCLWQRVPYAAVAVLAALAAFVKPARRLAPHILALIAVIFAASLALAVFHTGVEQHWWLGTEGCAITPLNASATPDLRSQLLSTAVAHCDQITWTFLGLSLANWNVPLSLGLAVFAALAARRANTTRPMK